MMFCVCKLIYCPVPTVFIFKHAMFRDIFY